MKINLQIFMLLISSIWLTACGAVSTQTEKPIENKSNSQATSANSETKPATIEPQKTPDKETSKTQTNQPKTVREFFKLLPQKYFTLEGCADNPTAKNCERARAEYLKNYLEVEDAANGYLKGGCDGAQSCLEMALFKRPNDTYIVGLTTSFEMGEDSYFLEYDGGAWKDIGAQVVPEYGKNKVYEMPRVGTTVAVYEYKKIAGEDYSERGRKLYDLIWKDGKFTVKK